MGVARHVRVRLPRLSPGRGAPPRRSSLVRHVVHADRRIRPVLLSADVRAVPAAVRGGERDDGDMVLDRALDRRVPRGRVSDARLEDRQVDDHPSRGLVVPVRLRREARPGRADPLLPVRSRMALARPADPVRRGRSAWRRDQVAAGSDPRLGTADPPDPRGHRGGRGPGRPCRPDHRPRRPERVD